MQFKGLGTIETLARHQRRNGVYIMLTFYNWRLKRSGACLRIIGDAIFGAEAGEAVGNFVKGHKISNVWTVELRDDNSIVATDRNGKEIAELRAKRERRLSFDEAAKMQHPHLR